MELKDALEHFSTICIRKYECFSEQIPQSFFLAQNVPKFHIFKNISLEMALRYIELYIYIYEIVQSQGA